MFPITVLEVLRRQRGYTSTDLALRAGYSRRTLSPIERRRLAAWPKLQQKVAEILNVDPAEIFDESGMARPWNQAS